MKGFNLLTDIRGR